MQGCALPVETSTHLATTHLDVIRSAYAAFERGDLATVLAMLEPDVEVYQSSSVPWGGRYRGLRVHGRRCGAGLAVASGHWHGPPRPPRSLE